VIAAPQRYNGYLKSHMPRIAALLNSGMTSIQIGHTLYKEGVAPLYLNSWTNCPAALAATIRAAFKREGIDIGRSKPINRWDNLLPEHLAKKQYMWERAMLIRRGKLAGLTNVEIGARLRIGASRVGDIIQQWRGSENGLSPVERYMHERPILWGQEKPSSSFEIIRHGSTPTGLSFWDC
jgi:hypothetical protein